MSHMTRIGIRELRQNASEYVRRAERGETIEVTDRGRPVACLSPLPEPESLVERLVALGRATPATMDILELGPPPPPTPRARPLSEALERIRDDRI
jgi:prevent-host-death family protein